MIYAIVIAGILIFIGLDKIAWELHMIQCNGISIRVEKR